MYLAGILAVALVAAIIVWLRAKPKPITLDPAQPQPPDPERPLQLQAPPPPAPPPANTLPGFEGYDLETATRIVNSVFYQRAVAFDAMIDQLTADFDARTFYSKIVGVTRRNADRKSRQKLIGELTEYDELYLEAEPENPVDPYAVRVEDPGGAQLGYLNARLAEEVVKAWAKGDIWRCWVAEITGGEDQTRGVNILLMTHEGFGEDVDPGDAQGVTH